MKSKIGAAAEKVEGNNMLLTCILVRLPPKSVFRFRCVSKRWNNIIAGTYFLRSYSNANISRNKDGLINSGDQRLLAFIQLTREHLDDRRRRLNDNSGVAELISTLRVPRELETDYFINSSNGLILCGSYSSKYTCLHVWNPLTQKRVSLPRPEIPNCLHNIMSIGLLCEENTNELVPNYTVVRATKSAGGDTLDIATYSSRTGTWAMSTLVSTGHFFLFKEPPLLLVCNNGIGNVMMHWRGLRCIALHDPNGGGDHKKHLQLIMLPLPYELTTRDSSFTRTSKHDDVLWFCNIDQADQHMQFWMLPKNNKDGLSNYRRSTTIPGNEWILMHTLTIDSLLKEPAAISSLLENNIERKKSLLRRFFKLSEFIVFPSRKQKPASSDLLFWLEALIPCNPIVVVLRRGDKVFLYNLETKSIESVIYPRGSAQSRWHPYMETLYLSSYALN